jgi:hypothetical protein
MDLIYLIKAIERSLDFTLEPEKTLSLINLYSFLKLM